MHMFGRSNSSSLKQEAGSNSSSSSSGGRLGLFGRSTSGNQAGGDGDTATTTGGPGDNRVAAAQFATLLLNQSNVSSSAAAESSTFSTISDVHTYKKIRSIMVDMVSSGRPLTKADFDSLFVELRRTQDFARQVSLPGDPNKLAYKDPSMGNQESLITAHAALKRNGLIKERDDDNLVKLLIWRQNLRLQQGFVPPSFSDVRQWIGMIYRATLEDMVEETNRFKNSKPRTRSELFLRLYILGKIAGVSLEFYHSDFRV